MKRFVIFTLLALSAISATAAEPAAPAAAASDEFNLVIKDHVFTPDELNIPAGKKVKIIVDNHDPTPEEFESKDLHREKVIKGGSKGTILVGPLKAGEYKFVGEFNEETAKGVIKVR